MLKLRMIPGAVVTPLLLTFCVLACTSRADAAIITTPGQISTANVMQRDQWTVAAGWYTPYQSIVFHVEQDGLYAIRTTDPQFDGYIQILKGAVTSPHLTSTSPDLLYDNDIDNYYYQPGNPSTGSLFWTNDPGDTFFIGDIGTLNLVAGQTYTVVYSWVNHNTIASLNFIYPEPRTYTLIIDGGSLTPAFGPANVPEPATMAIWGIGALGCTFGAYRRRKLAA